MSTKYAIVGGKLIDGTGAEPVENSLVLVDDNGKIEYAGAMQDLPEGVEVIDAAGKTTRNRTPGAIRSTVLGICARPSVVACARTPMPSRSGLPVAASGAGTPAATSTTAPRRFRPWSKRPRWSASPCGATATTTTPLPTIPFALAASS